MLNSKFKVKIVKSNEKNTKAILQQNNKHIFCIEGGGTKGVYAIGVLKYLFETNQYLDIKTVEIFGGTSVGSYLSTALSLGYQKDDILQISKIIDISKLIDSKYMFMMTAYRFVTQGYLYDDLGRQDIIKKILDLKINTIKQHLGLPADKQLSGKDLTFGDLKKLILTYPDIYKHLLINVVDISRDEQIFMTTLDNKWDDIKLFDAMLSSSSIPFVFKPVSLYYYPSLDKYGYQQTAESTVDMLVDGGVSTNNPLDYFLLNDDKFLNYKLWLLKFTSHSHYTKMDGTITLLKQLADYLISGKNDVKMDLIEDEYNINTINLHSSAGTLDIYTQEEIQKIIQDIYVQCSEGKLYFTNA